MKYARVFILELFLCAMLVSHDVANGSDADSIIIHFDPNLPQVQADSLVDRLFIQASSGEFMFRDLVQPSKDSIAALGSKALPRMCAKLTYRDARERWAIADIFRALGSIATDSLISYLGSKETYVLLNVGRCLEQIKDSTSTPACLPMLQHEKYTVRSQFATTLGKNKDTRAVPDLITALENDSVGDVRKSAAVALGLIGDSRAADVLIAHLADPYFGARKTAAEALLQLHPVPIDDIARAAMRLSGIYAGTAIETLGKSQNNKAANYLKELLKSSDPLIRGYTIDALAELDTKSARSTLKSLAKSAASRPLFEQARLRVALDSLDKKE